MNPAFGNVLSFARVWGTGRLLGNSLETDVGSRTACYSAEMNSIFLSRESFLMKLKKKSPYNLIYVTFCQLWFILLLLLVYFLGGFWMLNFWTGTRKLWASLTLTCQMEWRKWAWFFYISECLGWRRLYSSLVFGEFLNESRANLQSTEHNSEALHTAPSLLNLPCTGVTFFHPKFLFSQIPVLDIGTPQLP